MADHFLSIYINYLPILMLSYYQHNYVQMYLITITDSFHYQVLSPNSSREVMVKGQLSCSFYFQKHQ